LGTAGGPRIRADRSQPATAVVVGKRVYLFDIGYGTLRQLEQAGLPLNSVAAVFITHNHFDHNADLGPLIAFSWHAGRSEPIRIYGPPGTGEVVEQALGAFRHSIEIFNSEMPRPAPEMGRDVIAVESAPGATVYSDGVVTVKNVENAHFVHILPGSPADRRDKSYSYRMETPSGSVVISGDTGRSDALARLSKGADVLVSEILDEQAVRSYVKAWAARDNLSEKTTAETLGHMLDGHLASSDVGRLAAAANVCRLVMTHFVPSGAADPARLEGDIRALFSGEVIAGKDLQSIPVGCSRPAQ
jgi:ribonuclease BN (tRNA processing enzyme)